MHVHARALVLVRMRAHASMHAPAPVSACMAVAGSVPRTGLLAAGVDLCSTVHGCGWLAGSQGYFHALFADMVLLRPHLRAAYRQGMAITIYAITV